MKTNVEYDGRYPNLCSGNLIISINGRQWNFPSNCLSSTGIASIDDSGGEIVEEGFWIVEKWPEDFPIWYRKLATKAVN